MEYSSAQFLVVTYMSHFFNIHKPGPRTQDIPQATGNNTQQSYRYPSTPFDLISFSPIKHLASFSCSDNYHLSIMMKDFFLFGVTAVVYTILQLRGPRRQLLLNDDDGHDKDATEVRQLQKSLEAGTSLDAQERVCTVDEHNVPTSNGCLRSEMRLQNLWHRATYIIVRHVVEPQSQEDANDSSSNNVYILVQRRSKLKDYCPGKLDPTPGGVVGHGESYEVNAQREIMEEMGIDVEMSSPTGQSNTLTRLFTFPYQDEKVKCWGDLYEAVYRGPLEKLVIQKTEVDEVLRMSLEDVETLAKNDPDAFAPDSYHALQLYIQYKHDKRVKRRLLKGYSSGNLDAYGLRPKPEAIFFDCDDCLYFDGWNVANELTAKIDDWCVTRGLPQGEAYQLYKRHGTALRGLLAEGHIEQCDQAIDDYLRDVHDVPVADMLTRDEDLRDIIQQLDPTIPKYVFTASVHHHAERCLTALGIEDLFDGIIDVKACDLETKHSQQAFEAAMKVAGVQNPESCIFLDDSIKNIEAARTMGWRSVLVGRIGRDCGKTITTEHAEHEIDRIHQIRKILPELFVQ